MNDVEEAHARLLEEQHALRRLATLVAGGAAAAEIFAAVSDEIARLFRLELEPCDVAGVIRFDPGPEQVAVGLSRVTDAFPLGSRWPPRDLPSRVASSIVVAGRVWGALAIATRAPLPDDAEDRLVTFTELVAMAISNADVVQTLSHVADEQAALRRVATLVAGGAASHEVFDAVGREVGRLLDADNNVVGRYDADGGRTAIASWSATGGGVPVGRRSSAAGRNGMSLVAQTGRPARMDDYEGAYGDGAEIARAHGLRSSIAAPIMVEDRLWGAMLAGRRVSEPFPPGAEVRLAAFTDLLATAIANAQARDELGRYADEQAALRRVAMLVAQGTPPAEIFSAVSREVEALFGVDSAAVVKFEHAPPAVRVVGMGDNIRSSLLGVWSELADAYASTAVYRTGRSARVESDRGELLDASAYDRAYDAATGRPVRFTSSVACPIVVEGTLWGAMAVSATTSLPPDTEARLELFTDIVATALSNAASRDALTSLAGEQATLRRIATLVAQGIRPEELFRAVAEETAATFRSLCSVIRFEHNPASGLLLGACQASALPLGLRWELAEGMTSTEVCRSGRPVRLSASPEYWSARGGPVGEMGTRLGVVCRVACPILVEGGVWGTILISSHEELPPDAEERLEKYTDLMATAILNADSRDALARLAAEQAGLRRIATQVARGVGSDGILVAVADEVAAAIGAVAAVVRFDHAGAAVVVVAASAGVDLPIGTRWELSDLKALSKVYRSGQSVRFENSDWTTLSGRAADDARRLVVVSQVAAPIVVEGRLWGAISVFGPSRLPDDVEPRMGRFVELVATAIANAESKFELAASRRRIVSAGDEARRRIERDLHDGIQQRLIELTFRAQALSRRAPDVVKPAVAELTEGLTSAAHELREVSRGIHPAILTEAGLGPALRALARRSTVPVQADVTIDARFPEEIEAAAYYFASEALTNVAKHSRATVVELAAEHGEDVLSLRVRDDGVGGVDPSGGSGIRGLTDRIEALGGSLSIVSSAETGTALTVALPTVMPSAPLAGAEEGDHR
jgi:signal transduction histidine kinase